MTAGMVEAIVPVVALIATFGFPVAMVYVWKWFKFKDKELQADIDLRRTTGAALESRVQRLESIILALDADVRAKLAAPADPGRLADHDGSLRLQRHERVD